MVSIHTIILPFRFNKWHGLGLVITLPNDDPSAKGVFSETVWTQDTDTSSCEGTKPEAWSSLSQEGKGILQEAMMKNT